MSEDQLPYYEDRQQEAWEDYKNLVSERDALRTEVDALTLERNNWVDLTTKLRADLRNMTLRAARIDDLIREAKTDDTRAALSMLDENERLRAEVENNAKVSGAGTASAGLPG